MKGWQLWCPGFPQMAIFPTSCYPEAPNSTSRCPLQAAKCRGVSPSCNEYVTSPLQPRNRKILAWKHKSLDETRVKHYDTSLAASMNSRPPDVWSHSRQSMVVALMGAFISQSLLATCRCPPSVEVNKTHVQATLPVYDPPKTNSEIPLQKMQLGRPAFPFEMVPSSVDICQVSERYQWFIRFLCESNDLPNVSAEKNLREMTDFNTPTSKYSIPSPGKNLELRSKPLIVLDRKTMKKPLAVIYIRGFYWHSMNP